MGKNILKLKQKTHLGRKSLHLPNMLAKVWKIMTPSLLLSCSLYSYSISGCLYLNFLFKYSCNPLPSVPWVHWGIYYPVVCTSCFSLPTFFLRWDQYQIYCRFTSCFYLALFDSIHSFCLSENHLASHGYLFGAYAFNIYCPLLYLAILFPR